MISKKISSKFEGKVVSFSTSHDTLAMQNITFELNENRLFAVGEIPKGSTKNNWAAGRPCGIAWDSVVDFMVFDSESQYLELMALSEVDE